MWRVGATRLGMIAAIWLAAGVSPAWDQDERPAAPVSPPAFVITADDALTADETWRAGRIVRAYARNGAMLTYWPTQGGVAREDGLIETAVIVAGLGDVEILPVVLKVWRREDVQVVLAYVSEASAPDAAQMTLMSPLPDCGGAPHCYVRAVIREEADGRVTVDGKVVGRVE